MSHPYQSLPGHAYWKTGVMETDRDRWQGLYDPTVSISPKTLVSTAGSCFAQHIGTWLRRAELNILDAEPVPRRMSPAVGRRFGYGLFSGRYGNIYTPRQMLQLLEDVATGDVDDRFVWKKGDAFFDAFRPGVEPRGLRSLEEVLLHRAYHLERTAQLFRNTDVFIFTLGLTEAWADRKTGRVFPTCPGVLAGTFDEAEHVFVNQRYGEIVEDLTAIRTLLHAFNPNMELLLTVSPVPLTATASGQHVMVATQQSKATLRAAAGDFAADTLGVDYFPSFDMVMSHQNGAEAFQANGRDVSPDMVERVMRLFFAAHNLPLPGEDGTPLVLTHRADPMDATDDVVCEDLLLQAFAS